MTARALLLLFTCLVPTALAQAPPSPAESGGAAWDAPDAPRPVPADVLEELRADPDYQYDPDEAVAAVSWSDRLLQRLFDWIMSLFDGAEVDGGEASRVMVWLLYALAAIVLGWALLKLVRMEATNPLARGGAAVAQQQEDLADAARPPADLTALLGEAARDGRYAEAVRWQYLRLLGALGRAGLLDLQPSKTNRRYRAELAGHALGPDFDRASRLFDRVVYGAAELDADRYAVVAQRVTATERALAGYADGPHQPAVAV